MTTETIDIDIVAKGAAMRRPTLSLDVELYESYLGDSDLSEAQKAELLQSLWAIIVGFVDLGFAVEPATGPADKSRNASGEFASVGLALLESSTSGTTTKQFEKAAAPEAPTGS